MASKPLTTALRLVCLANYRSYSSSRADSNQVGGTKRFRHAVDSNGGRAMSIFDVSIVEQLELQ